VTVLTAQDLRYVRAGQVILGGIQCEAQGGEFIVVVGPNGAGKSTLLAVLAGLLQPDAGEVSLDQTALIKISAATLARRRAYLPQNASAQWPIAVWRLVALGLTAELPTWGDITVADRERVDGALMAFDLYARRDQAVTTLSGGELARAMLARAMVADPEILLVDEPLTGLDPRHAIDAVQRLEKLAKQQGKLVIASMHDLTLAMRCAARVWVLKDGLILADGPPELALTAQTLRQAFDVDASISGMGRNASIDIKL
jgi:iron complex transport system ATP-binding protein